MKLAAIDLGSNSVHMVLVETDRTGSFRVIGREKDMVRLGERTLARHRLSDSAIARGLEVLRKYRRLADSVGAEKVLAVATSAVREAANGEDFLDRAFRELGIRARAISGDEEARLIYLAALHSIHLEGRRALVVDIGGGSVELAVGAGQALQLAASEKIGVLRMTERFVTTDPLSGKDEARLVRHVESVLEPHVARVRVQELDAVVGTSGTILALGALALDRMGREVPESLHHVTVSAEAVHAARKWLVASDLRARLRSPAIDEGRADIVVAGAVVLDTILQQLGVKELTLCEWALREGLLLDYIHGHRRTLARAEAYPDVRRRSVLALAERCQYHEKHARKVAELSLGIFDGTRGRHGLGEPERALLEYAALLHDVGHHISYVGHHKHAYYLIKNADLRGFTPTEVEVVASVARYHRRGEPRRKHGGFGSLPRETRRIIRVLAGCLRLADALDRSHRQIVHGLAVSRRGRTVRLHLSVSADPSLELWGVPRRAELLEQALDVTVRVEAHPVVRPAEARAASPGGNGHAAAAGDRAGDRAPLRRKGNGGGGQPAAF